LPKVAVAVPEHVEVQQGEMAGQVVVDLPTTEHSIATVVLHNQVKVEIVELMGSDITAVTL
jgi:hypothetical protein